VLATLSKKSVTLRFSGTVFLPHWLEENRQWVVAPLVPPLGSSSRGDFSHPSRSRI